MKLVSATRTCLPLLTILVSHVRPKMDMGTDIDVAEAGYDVYRAGLAVKSPVRGTSS